MEKIKTSIIFILIAIIQSYPIFASDQCVEYPTLNIDSVKLQNKNIDSITFKYNSHRLKTDSVWLNSRLFLNGCEEWGFTNMDIKFISDSLFKCKDTRNVEINNVPYFNINENQKKLLSVPNLQYLSICNNWNMNIDTSIVNAPNLDSLILCDNRIDTLYDWLFRNGSLKYLQWIKNRTTYITNNDTSEIGISSITITEPLIFELPGILFRMKKLKIFVLSLGLGTDYSQIDTILQRNKNLEICAIYDSNIKEIPVPVFNLEKLYELVLCNCCLENVDSSIIRIKNLKILMLNCNRLTKLPEEIKELKDTLEELDLGGNPIPVEERERIKKWLPKTTIYFD